jgi:hypothetical protein
MKAIALGRRRAAQGEGTVVLAARGDRPLALRLDLVIVVGERLGATRDDRWSDENGAGASPTLCRRGVDRRKSP